MDRTEKALAKLAIAGTAAFQWATFSALNDENLALRTELVNQVTTSATLEGTDMPEIKKEERTFFAKNGSAAEYGAAGLAVGFGLAGLYDLSRRRKNDEDE